MPKEDWAENTFYKIFKRANLWPWAEDEIETILDVGCGLSFKSKFIPAKIRVGVDIYEEYFKHIEADVPYVTIKYDARKLKEIFMPKSFDLVLAGEIIEHLEKDEAIDLIKQCEEIARKGVILAVPKGFIPQNIDILGHGGHDPQTHRSAWEVEDLEKLGYTVLERDYTMSGVKRHTDMEIGEIDPHVKLLDAIKVL